MGLLDKIREFFKVKKEITPAELRTIMADLREDVNQALAIEDVAKREKAIKTMLSKVGEISVIVDDTLNKVEANIEELGEREFWATQELVDSDIRGLLNGRKTLIARKEELAKMNRELSELVNAKEDGQSEPGAE